jgi:hypothetical protein
MIGVVEGWLASGPRVTFTTRMIGVVEGITQIWLASVPRVGFLTIVWPYTLFRIGVLSELAQDVPDFLA